MGSVYIIHFIETGEEFAYTTVTALCEAHEDIGISRSRLNMTLKNDGIYSNKKINSLLINFNK